MPSVWEIEIRGIDPHHVRATGIHRFFSAWFGESPDEHAAIKGYSIASRTDDSDGVILRLGCADDGLIGALAALPGGQPVQFGTTHPRVGMVAAPPTCLVEEAWSILASYQGTTQWRIEFVTPVLLRSQAIDLPWPDPFALLRGLDAKWRRFGPAVAPAFDDDLARHVAVTGADLRTVESTRAPRPVLAAAGRVEWTWLDRRDPQRAGAAVVERLVRLAQYTGMGSYPQFGSGAVRVHGRRVDPAHPRPRRS